MKNNITARIDAVFQSDAKEAMFRLSAETIDEAADVIKDLATDILSFREMEINEEALRIKITGKADLENFYFGDKIHTVNWLESGYKSDVGKVRELDEDSIVIITAEVVSNGKKSTSSLFVLGDGVGGHTKGEVASYLGTTTAAQELIYSMLSVQGKTEDEIENSVRNSIKKANRTIYDLIKVHPEYGGMATTLVVALIKDRKLYVGNVGDSRAYLINDIIRQITRDHSVVQEMVDAGKITKEEARTHARKNVVTRVVGYYKDVEVDIFKENIFKQDIVLLCCDGLSDVVRDEEIKEVLVKSQKNFSKASEDLVRMANERGGPDNISVIIASSTDLPGKPPIPDTCRIPVPVPQEPSGDVISLIKRALPVAFAIIMAILLIGIIYMYFQPPKITFAAPPPGTDFNTTTETLWNFSIDIDQEVNVTWYINGQPQTGNESINVKKSEFSKRLDDGMRKVTAEASNNKGKANYTWNLNVSKFPGI